ncbi:GNAT family N-acetyltransferase [Mesobacillus foraminis]|uniref:GNAT family N-acetyltransferase n=1 Tax=Mesobacillus foraminis TaxID=279826 RepID=UPI000EF51A81|nr:GNAT family N-acetyltransferase [Mesobacillus foraminis]
MNIIYEGTLQQGGESFTVSELALENINEIIALQNTVINSLEKKETLQPLTKKEFQNILSGNGLMLGVFLEERLIGFRALLVPEIDEDHLGRDIGLSEEELPGVIYQEVSIVHQKYRGNRLQQTLAILIMQELMKTDNSFTHICCTVAPFNIPSLKDKFAQGMEIAALKEKYGGMLRYVFVKELAEGRDKDWSEISRLKMDDTEAQQEMLAGGWRGIQLEMEDGEYWVSFGRNQES